MHKKKHGNLKFQMFLCERSKESIVFTLMYFCFTFAYGNAMSVKRLAGILTSRVVTDCILNIVDAFRKSFLDNFLS